MFAEPEPSAASGGPVTGGISEAMVQPGTERRKRERSVATMPGCTRSRRRRSRQLRRLENDTVMRKKIRSYAPVLECNGYP